MSKTADLRDLVQAVKRNMERLPEDFMFQLNADEAAFLRSQTVTLKTGHGQHRKYLPYAVTEQGLAMRSSELLPTAVCLLALRGEREISNIKDRQRRTTDHGQLSMDQGLQLPQTSNLAPPTHRRCHALCAFA
jgi:ORF6N domain